MGEPYIEPTRSGRLKLALLAIGGVVALVAMNLWWHRFMDFVTSLPICDELPWLRAIAIAVALQFWSVGLLCVRAARLTLISGQSPFPGAWVWSRTRVRTGRRARSNGYMFAVIAAACFVGPVVAAYALRVNVIFCFPVSCGC